MARTRSLKPGFYKNDILAELPMEARYVFPGLWTLADREGRLEDRPKKIKGELMPFDEVNMDALLGQLADKGFITRYEVAGERYIQIDKFTLHQRPHPKEPPSTIPPPSNSTTSRGKTRLSRVKGKTGVIGNRKDRESEGKEGKEGKEVKEGEVIGMGEGSGEGGLVPSWINGFYAVFRSTWNGRYGGQDYDDERKTADFVGLARLQTNKALTPDNWLTACLNYLATPQESHTIADLALRYSTFLAHPLDRFKKPISTVNLNSKEQRTIDAGRRLIEEIERDSARENYRH